MIMRRRNDEEREMELMMKGSTTPEETAQKLMVRVQTGGRLLGFGRRVVVPTDEIHVVSGTGRHNFVLSKETQVFGAAAKQPSIYWRNSFTQVTALKTITFVVAVEGVNVLDAGHVPYTLTAHVVAKLDEEHAEIAAMRVGYDIPSLIKSIQEVTEAELIDAAAGMQLSEVIKNRQNLADSAQDKVNTTLKSLGYNLTLLKVSELGGEAYQKLVEQAQAQVKRDSTININAAELATHENVQGRERREAEVDALTRRETEAQQLGAERDVQRSKLDTTEELSIRQHELALEQTRRTLAAAEEQQRVNLQQVELDKGVKLAQVQRDAQVKQNQLELDQRLALQETEADATRKGTEQTREQERKAALTEAEATRLAREDSARADRERAVKLVEAGTAAEALRVRTEAEAAASTIQVESEAQSRLIRARGEAEAATVEVEAQTKNALLTAQREADGALRIAEAAKVRAEATRATEAATGLARADVAEREIQNDAARVTVTRDQGLAEVEVTARRNQAELDRERGTKEIEINAQQQLATLYQQAPVLVQLEQEQRQLAHAIELAKIEADARVQVMRALAPNIHLHLVGGDGRLGRVLSEVMALAGAYQDMGGTLPMLADGLSTPATGNGLADGALSMVTQALPAIQKAIRDMNPGVMTTMTASQLLDAVIPVLAGQEDALSAVNKLRQSMAFKIVADMPATNILGMLGLNSDEGSESITAS